MRRTLLFLAASALVLASCSGGGDAEPSMSTTPSASPSSSASPLAADPASLPVGTWVGEGTQPTNDVQGWDEFSMWMEVLPCAKGDPCGHVEYTSAGGESCRGTLTYLGIDGGAFAFDEQIKFADPCSSGGTDFLTPMSDGTLRFEWFYSGIQTEGGADAYANLRPAESP